MCMCLCMDTCTHVCRFSLTSEEGGGVPGAISPAPLFSVEFNFFESERHSGSSTTERENHGARDRDSTLGPVEYWCVALVE